MTSPSCILTMGTSPPRGVRLSCMVLFAPQLASVVTTTNSADPGMPKRTSLPSMFPPGCVSVAASSRPSLVRFGLPDCSAGYATKTPIRKTILMALVCLVPLETGDGRELLKRVDDVVVLDPAHHRDDDAGGHRERDEHKRGLVAPSAGRILVDFRLRDV